MQEMRANMAVLGKEAATSLAAVEAQQQRLTFQRLVSWLKVKRIITCESVLYLVKSRLRWFQINNREMELLLSSRLQQLPCKTARRKPHTFWLKQHIHFMQKQTRS
ncbi:hypothetical protein LINGRAHAP2_LOCUS5722 [Linum grandiflorum]